MSVQQKGKKRSAGMPKLWLESNLAKVFYCVRLFWLNKGSQNLLTKVSIKLQNEFQDCC